MTPECFSLGALQGEFYDKGRKLVLTRSFAYRDIHGVTILVPVRTTSDFNSVPRVLWSVFPPWHYPEAGVVHDYLYRNGGTWPHLGERPPYTRKQADAIHRDILKLTGASRFLCWTAHRSLRLFGRGAWKETP